MKLYDRLMTITVLFAVAMLIIAMADIFLQSMDLIRLFVESIWLKVLLFIILWPISPHVFNKLQKKREKEGKRGDGGNKK